MHRTRFAGAFFLAGWLLCLAACPVRAEEPGAAHSWQAGTLSQVSPRFTSVSEYGRKILVIEATWATAVCLLQTDRIKGDNMKLMARVRCRTEGLEGTVLLETWAKVDDRWYFSRGLPTQLQGTTEWREMEAPFFLQKGQGLEMVTLNLVLSGPGKVFVDRIDLERQKLPQQK